MVHRIAEYALLGDCHSSALVARDGSIDWATFPAFDSPAVFARILDERGGHFRVSPAEAFESERAYLPDTNVLVTTFKTEAGVVEVTDCMPLVAGNAHEPSSVRSHHSILRRVRCTRGSAAVDIEVAPRFEYGAYAPRFRAPIPTLGEIVGGADALLVASTLPVDARDDHLGARWSLTAGEEAWIEVEWYPACELPLLRAPVEPETFARHLESTIEFWREWMRGCWYEGEHEALVRRSALVLKALTYAPSGAVVAAPTTSLPEAIGGARNWDYRYTWIRDATLTLTALYTLGFRGEADAFKTWLERTGAGRPEDLQIMYGIDGRRSLPERELPHLAGHRGSRPVRVGNGAVKQSQLDAYGQILEAAYLYGKLGGSLDDDNWRFLEGLADIVADTWREPDHGIWEMRDKPRHFTHSKLHCWLALDRAIKLGEALGRRERVDAWTEARDQVAAYLEREAAPDGWFVQAPERPEADASVLMIPAVGFLPASDPRVLQTLDAVRRDLGRNGLLHRYVGDDGLEGGEGAFLLCSFWLIDALVYAGRVDEAEAIFERVAALQNDVGLFAEEADDSTGEALGNFPQAFTHMALVTSAAHLSLARRGEIDSGRAQDFAEVLLDRLAAAHPEIRRRR
jgi:GH15 family glucan-1,4-alpha-glucosidase